MKAYVSLPFFTSEQLSIQLSQLDAAQSAQCSQGVRFRFFDAFWAGHLVILFAEWHLESSAEKAVEKAGR